MSLIIGMMKILSLSPFNFLPPYFGGAKRLYYITKHLAKENKIWVICNNFQYLQKNYKGNEYQQISNNPNIYLKFVKSHGSYSQIINFSGIFEALKLIKKIKPDLIFANYIFSGLHAIILKGLTGIPYVLDEYDAEFHRREMISGNSFKTKLMRWYEKQACQKASKIFCENHS